MAGKDWVYCGICGEEYRRDIGHTCNPRTLAELQREAEADTEVRRKGGDKPKPVAR